MFALGVGGVGVSGVFAGPVLLSLCWGGPALRREEREDPPLSCSVCNRERGGSIYSELRGRH